MMAIHRPVWVVITAVLLAGISCHAFSSDGGIPSTFPLARRVLLEKAEEMGTLSKSSGGTYGTVGWSNRLGSLLTPAAIPGVYEAGRPFFWNGIDVGCRMVVIELGTSSPGADGKPDLFVHSPVSLDDRLADAIDAIGTVKHVVSPNYEHVKWAAQWKRKIDMASKTQTRGTGDWLRV